MNRGTWIAALAALAFAGCASPGVTTFGITDEEFGGLVSPVPGAEPGDYRARERTVRLFGVQGDPPFATVADTATWETWNLRVSDTFGRGLRASAVNETIVLEDAEGRALTLARGADVKTRTITHRLDDAAIYEGRATWHVEAAAMKEVLALHGAGAETASRLDLFPVPATELVSVDADGAMARLGFRAGDFLFETTVDEVLQAAASSGTFSVSIYRAGAPGTRTYRVE